jgi:hypothetical protein
MATYEVTTYRTECIIYTVEAADAGDAEARYLMDGEEDSSETTSITVESVTRAGEDDDTAGPAHVTWSLDELAGRPLTAGESAAVLDCIDNSEAGAIIADAVRLVTGALAADGDDMLCSECGEPAFISDEGTAHHWGETPDNIDHDADADHVPALAEDFTPDECESCGAGETVAACDGERACGPCAKLAAKAGAPVDWDEDAPQEYMS